MELPAPHPSRAADSGRDQVADPEADTVDVDLSGGLAALVAERNAGAGAPPAGAPGSGNRCPAPAGTRAEPFGGRDPLGGSDLLDDLPGWAAAHTAAGTFQLVPVRLERDLPLIAAWMNDPAVAAFWDLAGPVGTTASHLRAQLDGDGRSAPCLGVLDGVPMSYWEVYRADLDPLARHYPARPHDTGVHLLVGGVTDRGRGLGTTLLRAVGDLVLAHRPSCRRVLAEPDLRNVPSVAAFLGAGFRFSAEVDLPDKRAALMIRDR
ncbi:GNAT family N-acetyltransferase [Streptomyces sp. DSM 42041]|uniref:Lysine N-acyltransferase MbtK n=1 Tax=Streptomyces hazeniae TaxID=3075538 RepID=A0ABU2NZ69_9ACTN|nr:GNAT family N-acetyltransferase [Streptomyces sp. DSM 42041]MDT0382276.1 GNAT family N-acetyltransferase [Streptomyces sp. DSM 42041]